MLSKETDFKNTSLPELRILWENSWKIKPHRHIGRKMLIRSLVYKLCEQNGEGLAPDQKYRLNKLVRAYKRNQYYFEQGHATLKPGMKLIRNWQGKIHSVTVTTKGFIYNNNEYSSLSAIASIITGSRWNGWVFFGIKNKQESL